MGYFLVKGDITEISADIVVNASNGIGYMGGIIGRLIKLKGVAESINYATRGIVEREAKKACKRNKHLPRLFCGYKAGEVFVTGAGDLKAKYIIHAVTMPLPGMVTYIEVIKTLLLSIILKAYELKAKSIAIPILGAGTGGLEKGEVLKVYEEFFNEVINLKIIVVSK